MINVRSVSATVKILIRSTAASAPTIEARRSTAARSATATSTANASTTILSAAATLLVEWLDIVWTGSSAHLLLVGRRNALGATASSLVVVTLLLGLEFYCDVHLGLARNVIFAQSNTRRAIYPFFTFQPVLFAD